MKINPQPKKYVNSFNNSTNNSGAKSPNNHQKYKIERAIGNRNSQQPKCVTMTDNVIDATKKIKNYCLNIWHVHNHKKKTYNHKNINLFHFYKHTCILLLFLLCLHVLKYLSRFPRISIFSIKTLIPCRRCGDFNAKNKRNLNKFAWINNEKNKHTNFRGIPNLIINNSQKIINSKK